MCLSSKAESSQSFYVILVHVQALSVFIFWILFLFCHCFVQDLKLRPNPERSTDLCRLFLLNYLCIIFEVPGYVFFIALFQISSWYKLWRLCRFLCVWLHVYVTFDFLGYIFLKKKKTYVYISHLIFRVIFFKT